MELTNKIKLRSKQLLYKFPKLQKHKRIFLFLLPTHGNLGDQAIAIAESKYLSDQFPKYQVIEIPDFASKVAILKLRKKIHDDDLIMLHGGGNIGTLYPGVEGYRRQIINNFPNNHIIIFPQSVYFSADTKGERFKKETQDIFNNHDNLTIVARDSDSYMKMTSMFNLKKIKILKMPDIVLYLNNIANNMENRSNDILFALRNDIEKKLNDSIVKEIIYFLKEKNIKYILSDTVVPYNISLKERDKEVQKKWDEFKTSKLVITDRLHGMIFSFITRTPCIVLSNNNPKIESAYHDWLSNFDFIHFVKDDDVEEIKIYIVKYLNIKIDSQVNFNLDLYKPFTENINEILKRDNDE